MANGNGSGSTAIEIDRLTKWFGSTCAVNELSFSVRKGEALGFIGPNGAGKTTTMRILATLEEPDLGDAFVDGFSCTNDPDSVRKRLGFMPDAYGAYHNVSCVEYLDFFARSYGLKGRERTRAVNRVLDFTHMHHMMDKPTTGLSKGMKQRLCLGRTLIHDPQVLILDEPAAGLDPRARIELKEMINRLLTEGKTLLISSHILTELAEMCSRVAIIEHGNLLAVGSVQEILNKFTGEMATDSEDHLTTVIVRFLGESQPLLDFLAAKELRNLRLNGDAIEFAIRDDENWRADLLAELVRNDFRIFAFSTKERSLEEAFMRATRGRVQ